MASLNKSFISQNKFIHTKIIKKKQHNFNLTFKKDTFRQQNCPPLKIKTFTSVGPQTNKYISNLKHPPLIQNNDTQSEANCNYILFRIKSNI